MTSTATDTLKMALYTTAKEAVANIVKLDPFYGKFAQRKLDAISVESDLETFIQVGDDLTLIASKVTAS